MATLKTEMSVMSYQELSPEKFDEMFGNISKANIDYFKEHRRVTGQVIHTTELIIDQDQNNYPKPDWPSPDYLFCTESPTQILIVKMNTKINDASGAKKRYHFNRVLFECPGLVECVADKLPNETSFSDLPAKDAECRTDADSIAVMFSMPGNKKTLPKKLHVFFRDVDTGDIHYADPQVGNDPP